MKQSTQTCCRFSKTLPTGTSCCVVTVCLTFPAGTVMGCPLNRRLWPRHGPTTRLWNHSTYARKVIFCQD